MIETEKGHVNIGKELFWDIPEKDMGMAFTQSKDWVIVRVFEYGTLDEIAEIIDYYGKPMVKNALSNAMLRPVAKAMGKLFLDLN